MTRSYPAVALLVLLGTMIWIAYNTRDGREIEHDVAPKAVEAVVVAGPPLPKSKAEIVAALSARGFVLLPFELSVTVPGVSACKINGAPLGVAFTERDGTLREVEAMSLPGMSDSYIAVVEGFGTTLGEVTTGEPHRYVDSIVENALYEVGKSPGSATRFIDRVRLDVIRHDGGGYSFKFTAKIKPKASPPESIGVPALRRTKAEIVAALEARGFPLESFESSTPTPGATGYRIKGAPDKVTFYEHDEELLAVEVMTPADKSEENTEKIINFATMIGEIVTGETRETCHFAIENMVITFGWRPGSRSLWMSDEKNNVISIEIIKRNDGGFSFKFAPLPSAASKADPESKSEE